MRVRQQRRNSLPVATFAGTWVNATIPTFWRTWLQAVGRRSQTASQPSSVKSRNVSSAPTIIETGTAIANAISMLVVKGFFRRL